MAGIDRQSLVFFIIMFIFLTLPNGNDQPHSYQERQTLTTFQNILKSGQQDLKNRQYYQGYGNLTGFLLSYDDQLHGKSEEDWPIHHYNKDKPWIEDEKFSILPNVVSSDVKSYWGQDKVDLTNDDELGYLFNISGRIEGDFKLSDDKVEKVKLKLPKYLSDYYDAINSDASREGQGNEEDGSDIGETNLKKIGNITYDEGKVYISIKSLGYNFKDPELLKLIKNPDDRVEDAVMVELKINLMDYPEIDKNDIDTYGIYFQDSGSLISISSSGKFLGNAGLPSLTMNEENFKKSQKLMVQILNGTNIEKQVSMDDMNNHITRSFEQCEFINYLKFEKTEYLNKELREIDEELINPNGKPLAKNLPKLKLKKMTMYSPDCGIIINNKGTIEGEKSEVINNQLRHVLIGFIGLICIQLYLFLYQIEKSKTPGQLSNISSLTLILLQYQDALIALIFLLISTIFEKLYLLLVAIAIFTYIMCGIFEMGFLTKVIKTQINERGTTWWEILRGSTGSEGVTPNNDTNTNGTATTTTNTEGGLPPPATAQNPAATTTTVPTTVEGEEANVWNSIFAPGFAITIISTFLILNSSLWRKSYRKIFEIIGVTLFNSYWLPQFFRNTLKNRKVPFSWKFILGTTIIRIIPIIYLNLFPNPFNHERNIGFLIFLMSWLILQLALIYLQNFNPRFWINDKWLPKAYNYHPIIDLQDLEHYASDLISNFNLQASEGEHDETIIKTDCAICMNAINLPIYKNKKHKVNKDYMVTPCFHIFHSECLEDWMKYKLQCPICRNGLPPI